MKAFSSCSAQSFKHPVRTMIQTLDLTWSLTSAPFTRHSSNCAVQVRSHSGTWVGHQPSCSHGASGCGDEALNSSTAWTAGLAGFLPCVYPRTLVVGPASLQSSSRGLQPFKLECGLWRDSQQNLCKLFMVLLVDHQPM